MKVSLGQGSDTTVFNFPEWGGGGGAPMLK